MIYSELAEGNRLADPVKGGVVVKKIPKKIKTVPFI